MAVVLQKQHYFCSSAYLVLQLSSIQVNRTVIPEIAHRKEWWCFWKIILCFSTLILPLLWFIHMVRFCCLLSGNIKGYKGMRALRSIVTVWGHIGGIITVFGAHSGHHYCVGAHRWQYSFMGLLGGAITMRVIKESLLS